MTITITIAIDNDAFADDPQGEVQRILEEWLRQDGLHSSLLTDVNGNTVGHVIVTGR